MPSSHVESHLWAQNVAYCKPQLQWDEVASICQSVIGYFSSAGNDGQNANVPTPPPIHMRDNGAWMLVSLATVPKPGPWRFVIEDLIPEDETSILYGDGGPGKSLLALYFGTCVATGIAVLDQKVEKSPALYLVGWQRGQISKPIVDKVLSFRPMLVSLRKSSARVKRFMGD